MSEDVKKTKGVLRMRDVFEQVIMAVEADELDTKLFSPTTCDNCIHKEKSLEENPCSTCTTALEHHGRDYRPSDQYHWRPSMLAKPDEIRKYYEEYGVPSIKDLMTHPPVRCINPRCSHDYASVYNRGLCKQCHKILEDAVVLDQQVAEDWVLMYGLCDSEEERAFVSEYYLQLYSWDRFEREGRCLPLATEIPVGKELILYYRQTRNNYNRRNNQDPTPTEKQLSKLMNSEQLAQTRKYLVIKNKK